MSTTTNLTISWIILIKSLTACCFRITSLWIYRSNINTIRIIIFFWHTSMKVNFTTLSFPGLSTTCPTFRPQSMLRPEFISTRMMSTFFNTSCSTLIFELLTTSPIFTNIIGTTYIFLLYVLLNTIRYRTWKFMCLFGFRRIILGL